MKIEDVILFLAFPNSACVIALKQMSLRGLYCMQITLKFSVIPRLPFPSSVEGFAIKISDTYLPLVHQWDSLSSHSAAHSLQIWEFTSLGHLPFHQLA